MFYFLVLCFCFFFFFSSRRRHTRSLCDWSSDVCSSDLVQTDRPCLAGGAHGRALPIRGHRAGGQVRDAEGGGRAARSEERRVGKECRSRWSADHYKKNMKRTVRKPAK